MFNENSRLIQKIINGATKFANQRHILSIRNGFIDIMPLTIIASFWVLLNNTLLNPETGVLRFISNISLYSAIGNNVFNATLGILSILIAFTTGSRLATTYGENKIVGGFTGVAPFVTLLPETIMVTSIDEKTFEVSGVLSQELTSATGMIIAIIASLVGVTLLSKLNKYEILKIKMPESVPPAISRSFNVLIPIFITTFILSLVQFITVQFFQTTIPNLVIKTFQTPLVGSIQTLPGILLYASLSNLLWVFGVHGTSILGSIGEPIMLTSLQENIDALRVGEELPNIVTKPFIDIFGWMGGGGNLLCLVFAIMIVSKREDYKAMSKVSIIPAIFNVSEPMMFGLPVVFNPFLAIPLILVPFITIGIGYLTTSIGLIDKTSVLIPWTTPPIISSYLATNGDWRATVLQIFMIILGTLIYVPFVKMTDKTNI